MTFQQQVLIMALAKALRALELEPGNQGTMQDIEDALRLGGISEQDIRAQGWDKLLSRILEK